MASLNKKQFRFSLMVAILIIYAYVKGHTISFGDAWALKGKGRPHSENSKHYSRLAIDLNLFYEGKFLVDAKKYEFLGSFWKLLGGTWGGDFREQDCNHFSWDE